MRRPTLGHQKRACGLERIETLRRRSSWWWACSALAAVLLAVTLLGVHATVARADLPDNDIVIHPAGRAENGGETVVVGSRQPAITLQLNYGSETQVRAGCAIVENENETPAWGSCGTRAAGCPVSECWLYQPTVPSDGDYEIEVAIFDSTQPQDDSYSVLDELVQPILVDSASPDTAVTGSAPQFDTSARVTRAGVPVTFAFKAIDTLDAILYPDSPQCAITTGAAPSAWSSCERPPRVPLTTRAERFWVRAVNWLGVPDPTPAESPPFSAIPCTARVLGHPHSLRQIARHRLHVRLSCLQPTPYYLSLQIPPAELRALARHHPEINSAELGHASGRTRLQGQSPTVALRLLRGIPASLFADRRLSLELKCYSGAELKPTITKRVTGR